MVRSPWKRFLLERCTPIGPGSRRRRPTRTSPGCEVLDERRLPSTAAATPELMVPPAASVRMAASYLAARAPAEFARFRTAMARAVQHSDIDQADVGALAQDEAVVVQDIESAGLARGQVADDLHSVEDAVDFAVSGSPGIHSGQRFIPLPQVSGWLDSKLSNVPAFGREEPSAAVAPDVPRAILASGPPVLPVDQLVDQVTAVARMARPPRAIQSALNRSYDRLCDALGRDAITDLGPGESRRDAIVVYYEGQVNRWCPDCR